MNASLPIGISELTAAVEELPKEYGLNLIRQLPQADLPMLKTTLERLMAREPTSPRERATRDRVAGFLEEVCRLVQPVVEQSRSSPGKFMRLREVIDKAFDNPYTALPLTLIIMIPVGLIGWAILTVLIRWVVCWVFCDPF